jgi:hypothetical protein
MPQNGGVDRKLLLWVIGKGVLQPLILVYVPLILRRVTMINLPNAVKMGGVGGVGRRKLRAILVEGLLRHLKKLARVEVVLIRAADQVVAIQTTAAPTMD